MGDNNDVYENEQENQMGQYNYDNYCVCYCYKVGI